jgi:tRNA(fMet)-specific endonuclease VapC
VEVIGRILIDTNVYTAFKLNDPRVTDLLRRAEQVALNPVVMAELLAGFRGGDREAYNRGALQKFLASPRVILLSMDRDTAEHYAAAYTTLRRKGRPIPTNDLWIAASALQYGMGLLSMDGHFAEIDGLITV